MENTKNWLDDLKLRFSYGTAGNNNIPSGQISQLYELNKTPWINGVNSYIAPSKYMANSDLTCPLGTEKLLLTKMRFGSMI